MKVKEISEMISDAEKGARENEINQFLNRPSLKEAEAQDIKCEACDQHGQCDVCQKDECVWLTNQGIFCYEHQSYAKEAV